MKMYKKLFFLMCFFIMSTSEAFYELSQFIPQFHIQTDVEVGDLNGDGVDDLFMVYGGNPHQVFFGSSDEDFEPSSQFFGKFGANDVELVDLDNDGDLDAWVGIRIEDLSNDDYFDEVFLNNGEGRFEKVARLPTMIANPSASKKIASVDFDGNGEVDIFRGLANGNILVYINPLSSQFKVSAILNGLIEDDRFIDDLVLADLDDDGYEDIVLNESCRISIYFTDGTLNADQYQHMISNGGCGEFFILDIDGDGDLDLQSEPGIRLRNDGDRSFQYDLACYTDEKNPQNCDELRGGQQIEFVDYDKDGDLDLWVFSLDYNVIIPTNSEGLHSNAQAFNKGLLIDSFKTRMGDFDGDGLQDVFVFNAGLDLYKKYSYGFKNTGNLNFSKMNTDSINEKLGTQADFSIVNLNSDIYPDIQIQQHTSPITLSNDGYGDFFSSDSLPIEAASLIRPVYFNKDHLSDYYIAGTDFEALLLSQSDGAFIKKDLDIGANAAFNYVVFVDFDNDQFTDIIHIKFDIVNLRDRTAIEVWQNDKSNNFSLIQTIELDEGTRFAYPGLIDMDDDGQDELVVYHYTLGCSSPEPTGTVDIYQFIDNQLMLLKSGSYQSCSYDHPGDIDMIAGIKFATMDWDKDGDLDFLTDSEYNSIDSPKRLVLINNENQLEPLLVDFPFGEIKDSADYDQDGDQDFFLFRNPDDYEDKTIGTKAYLIFNDGKGGFDNQLQISEGERVKKVSSTDFDLDGDIDLVVQNYNRGLLIYSNNLIKTDYSGFWVNMQQPGQGIHVEWIDKAGAEKLLLNWFIIDNGQPLWLYGEGFVKDDQSSIELQYFEGGEFRVEDHRPRIEAKRWGMVSLDFVDNNTLTVVWHRQAKQVSMGQMIMSRSSSITSADVDRSVLQSCHSGSWYSPNNLNHGFMVEVIGQPNERQLLMSWLTYKNEKPYWIYAQGPVIENKATLVGLVFEQGKGSFPVNYETNTATMEEWGQIEFVAHNNNSASVNWRPSLDGFSEGGLDIVPLTKLNGHNCFFAN